MNDINIACFMSCARTKSFSAAANDLSITHQAVSRNIQKLEEEIGCKLLLRNNQTVSLTKAGEFFLGWMTEMDARLEWANDYFYSEHSRHPRLRIAFADWLGLPGSARSAIEYVEAEQPGLNTELYTGSESFLFQLLRNRKTDVVIVPGQAPFTAEESPDIFTTTLSDTKTLQLIYSRRYVNRDGSVDYNSLFSEKLLTCGHKSPLNKQFDMLCKELCDTHGCQPAGTEYIPNFNSVISEIVLGNGFTFAPEGAVIDREPVELLKFESLEHISFAEVNMVCMWRLAQGSEHVLKYIERMCSR